jgi:hypothetical protein
VRLRFRWGVVVTIGIYALGAAGWFYFAFVNSQAVPSAADSSFVPLIRDFFHQVVSLDPAAWALAVAVGELGLAALILFRATRPAGLLLATFWQVFGAGLAMGWPLILGNLVIAAFQLALFIIWLRQSDGSTTRARRRFATG